MSFANGVVLMVNESCDQKRNETIPIQYQLKILSSIRRIIRAVDIYSRKLVKEYNVTTPQHVCLFTIVDEGPLTVSELGKHVSLGQSTVVGILDRLEKKDMIRRDRDTTDRRKVFVSATELGKAAISQSPSPLQDKLADELSKLSELEQSTIALSLEHICEMMEAQDIEAGPILETKSVLE